MICSCLISLQPAAHVSWTDESLAFNIAVFQQSKRTNMSRCYKTFSAVFSAEHENLPANK